MSETARHVFSFPNARNALAELLAPPSGKYAIDTKQSSTSTTQLTGASLATQNTVSILRILARPEMRDVARDILSRPEVQENIPRLLMSPEIRPLLLQALNSPGLPKFATVAAARDVSLQTVINAAASPSAGTVFPRAEMTPENTAQKLTELFGPQSGQPLSEKALQQIEIALQRLANVSPERAAQAMKTLGALAILDVKNLDVLVAQVATRLETISPQLAQKGGLPTSLSEPVLQTSTLLPLRIDNLPPERLMPMVDRLASNGAEITFVGRTASGSTQIFLQVAEMPPGSAEWIASSWSGTTLQTANLTAQEHSALATLFPNQHVETAINYTMASMFAWMPTNKAVPTETTVKDRTPAEEDATQEESDATQKESDAIPSMLDLVRMEPLLLGYTPGELMVPGTDIPLILPPDWGKGEDAQNLFTDFENFTDFTVQPDETS